MRTTYKNEFKELEMRIRRNERERIEDVLWHRYDMIDRLLMNGRAVMETTYGDRFCRMVEVREKLFAKMDMIVRTIGMISKAQ